MLDKMKPGDITEPLRTKAGYQIFQLDSRSASEAEPFEKSRDQIRQRILESRQDVERAKFLDKLRIQAVIEWKDAAYEKMYDEARAAQAKNVAARIGK
jgi:peptidyl-prolyl cis-trans isomerase SurA